MNEDNIVVEEEEVEVEVEDSGQEEVDPLAPHPQVQANLDRFCYDSESEWQQSVLFELEEIRKQLVLLNMRPIPEIPIPAVGGRTRKRK